MFWLRACPIKPKDKQAVGPQRRLQALGADRSKTFDTYDEDFFYCYPCHPLRVCDVMCRGVIITKSLCGCRAIRGGENASVSPTSRLW